MKMLMTKAMALL